MYTVRSSVGKVAGLLLAASVLAACTSAGPEVAEPEAEGPPTIRPEVVDSHASQFDEDLAPRRAGSQQEEAAAVYILGHLQRAGYIARLESVPVADTVSSTDVIALPPSGESPETVVAVAYDGDEDRTGDGANIGLFLELARAMRVAAPDHSVEFVALGAERTSTRGGYLGTRRLAALLKDSDEKPFVITVEDVREEAGAAFGAFGPEVSALTEVAEGIGVPLAPLPPPDPVVGEELSERGRILVEAGFDHAGVTGGADEVGRVLMEYLTS